MNYVPRLKRLSFYLLHFQYFQNQKFLDCTLLVEGKHLLQAHKFVLDSCSDYFSSLLKNKLLDDKNLVICLPKEIKLWEIQALLVYMYNGQVAIEQEGLQSLVKCAEMLQIKGLCGNDTTECHDDLKNAEDDIEESDRTETMAEQQEAEKSPATSEEHNEKMVIKREVDISDVESCPNDDVYQQSHQPTGLIRVKSNLFETDLKDNSDSQAITEDFHHDDDTQHDKNNAKLTTATSEDDDKRCCSSSPLLVESTQQYENIVCSPALMQYDDGADDDDDDVYIEDDANVCTNDALFQLITQKLGGFAHSEDSNDVDSKSKLMIASVSSQYQSCAKTKSNYTSDKKVAIGGLYLRNPRGNQERKYDVNALYSALQDVKNGHSIYRWVMWASMKPTIKLRDEFITFN